jgi:hypothetical protein
MNDDAVGHAERLGRVVLYGGCTLSFVGEYEYGL